MRWLAPLRPDKRHLISYAVIDRREGDYALYRVVDHKSAHNDEKQSFTCRLVSCVEAAVSGDGAGTCS